MRTKPNLDQESPCEDCLTVEDHLEHIERKDQRVLDVQARLAWISLQRSGGIIRQPARERDAPLFATGRNSSFTVPQ